MKQTLCCKAILAWEGLWTKKMYQTALRYSWVAGVSGTRDACHVNGQRAQQGCLLLCLFEGGEEMFSSVLTSVVRMLWLSAPQLTSGLLMKAFAVRCLQKGRKEGCPLRTPRSGKQGEGMGSPTLPGGGGCASARQQISWSLAVHPRACSGWLILSNPCENTL